MTKSKFIPCHIHLLVERASGQQAIRFVEDTESIHDAVHKTHECDLDEACELYILCRDRENDRKLGHLLLLSNSDGDGVVANEENFALVGLSPDSYPYRL